MTNAEIAAIFDEMADILDFQGANTFRVRAYRNASRTVKDLGESLAQMRAAGGKFMDIDGIGKDLAEKITTLLEAGQLQQHQELRAAVPAKVLLMLRIPGLGPRKAAVLYKELGITTLEMLREACHERRVRDLKGFGAKTEDTILKGLAFVETEEDRIYWSEADIYAQELLQHMRGCMAVRQVEVAGSYRRGKETIGDLDVLVDGNDSELVMDHLGIFPGVDDVLARGETKMSIRLASGIQVDLRVVPEESFGAALQYFTGSKEHNVILRSRAKARGLKINEWGVFRDDKYLGGRTEEEIYDAMNLPCMPPELREARREFDWADMDDIPELIELRDIRGDLHMHTTETDGKATLEEMVAAAKEKGHEYIAITDHSKRVTMANGLDGPRLIKQWEQIDKLNQELTGITVLKGVEVDILEKGGLDLEDEILAQADWVVASIHFGQNQSRAQITQRIVDALANPHVCAIAHPTGRLINRRKAYEVDLDAVYQAASEHGKMLELNANPARLDLNDVACMTTKDHDIPIVISTDAHSTERLNGMRYGVLQARRAGLTRYDVANTRTWNQLQRMLGR
ncbi:MAG: DNA polymerase/3'-5' exonuclease PolX [Pirellulales bacterium]|nr:DNA polymerase/3'-5' exonuclease PolX [Pirellulales bacterium]